MSLEEGKRVLRIEAQAITKLIERLDHRFEQAVELLHACTGKVVVSGMGKSGLIGAKLAATLASTGTPAFVLDPAAGAHGDLGMLARKDVFIAISNSGETEELLKLLPYVKRFDIPVITMTGRPQSTLAKNSEVVLDVSVAEEACPLGLAPTASTTATLAMGDALAIALLQRRGFKEEDFAQFHPGGTLGRRLLLRVRDLMHEGEAIPRVPAGVLLSEAILEMTSKKLGMTTVVDAKGQLAGIITDGDLRRFIQRGLDLVKTRAGEVATKNPKTIKPTELAARAVQIMEQYSITTLVVLNEQKHIVGVVHLHDLLKSGVV
ncbi:MAG: KpsF/GutQ family sugar-phosphate isomerase [Nitrospirales bacterium]